MLFVVVLLVGFGLVNFAAFSMVLLMESVKLALLARCLLLFISSSLSCNVGRVVILLVPLVDIVGIVGSVCFGGRVPLWPRSSKETKKGLSGGVDARKGCLDDVLTGFVGNGRP